VHARDPDREGQLIVAELLVFLSYKGSVDPCS
jgi:DNA topoisomerase IA